MGTHISGLSTWSLTEMRWDISEYTSYISFKLLKELSGNQPWWCFEKCFYRTCPHMWRKSSSSYTKATGIRWEVRGVVGVFFSRPIVTWIRLSSLSEDVTDHCLFPFVVVTKPPYEITETGWGEFEIIIKIFFIDPNERPVRVWSPFSFFCSVYERFFNIHWMCVFPRWLCIICWSCSSLTPAQCLKKQLSQNSMMKWYVCITVMCKDTMWDRGLPMIFVFFALSRSSRIPQPWCSSYWPHPDSSHWERTNTRPNVRTHN